MSEAAYGRASADRKEAGGGRRRVRVMRCLWLSLVLSIVVEWVGMTLWWSDLGSGHAAAVMRREAGYLHGDFGPAAERIVWAAGRGYYWGFEWTGVAEGLEWAAGQVGTGLAAPFRAAGRPERAGPGVDVLEYVRAALWMVQVLMVRVVLLVFSLPAFALFGVVGVTSGLTLRDIRRWSAGREFGGVYHTAKRLAPRALAAAAVVYLAIPVAVHPTAVIVPGAALFGLLTMVVAASFKKYL